MIATIGLVHDARRAATVEDREAWDERTYHAVQVETQREWVAIASKLGCTVQGRTQPTYHTCVSAKGNSKSEEHKTKTHQHAQPWSAAFALISTVSGSKLELIRAGGQSQDTRTTASQSGGRNKSSVSTEYLARAEQKARESGIPLHPHPHPPRTAPHTSNVSTPRPSPRPNIQLLFFLSPGQRLAGHRLKCRVDIHIGRGRRLKERRPTLGGRPRRRRFRRHTSRTARRVNLVAEHDKREAFRVARGGRHEKLVTPRLERLKRPPVGHIIYEHARVGAAVKGRAERLVPLLPGCVPNLQVSRPPVDGYVLREKVGADGGLVLAGEAGVDVALHEGGLTNPMSLERCRMMTKNGCQQEVEDKKCICEIGCSTPRESRKNRLAPRYGARELPDNVPQNSVIAPQNRSARRCSPIAPHQFKSERFTYPLSPKMTIFSSLGRPAMVATACATPPLPLSPQRCRSGPVPDEQPAKRGDRVASTTMSATRAGPRDGTFVLDRGTRPTRAGWRGKTEKQRERHVVTGGAWGEARQHSAAQRRLQNARGRRGMG